MNAETVEISDRDPTTVSRFSDLIHTVCKELGYTPTLNKSQLAFSVDGPFLQHLRVGGRFIRPYHELVIIS